MNWREQFLILSVLFLFMFVMVRLHTSPGDVMRKLVEVETKIDQFKLLTSDRWSRTDHIIWEKKLQESNSELKVPVTKTRDGK